MSCQTRKDKLFWIDEKIDYCYDLISMVESANILPISIDSIDFFLSEEEIKTTKILENKHYQTDSVFHAPIIFKNYGRLYQSDGFVLSALLRINNGSEGGDYKFMLRTYDKDWEIIETYDLAIWNKLENKFCFGSTNKKLIIEKCYKDSEYSEIMQITQDGKIIVTSFRKS